MSADRANESSVQGQCGLVTLYSPGICPWVGCCSHHVGGLVLFMSHPPLLPPGSCLITCLDGIRGVSHSRGGKSFLLIYSERSAASLTTVY